MPALSGRERAILVLRAAKAHEEEPLFVRSKMTPTQASEFNHLIRLMNVANGELGSVIMIIREQTTQLQLKYAWFTTVRVLSLDFARLATYFAMDTKEPITQKQWKELEQELGAEKLSLDEAATIAAELSADEDGVANEPGDPDWTGEAWSRVEREQRQGIITAIGEGKLAAEGRGKRLTIETGAFYDWLGKPMPVFPDWALEYDVYPDDEEERVTRLQRSRRDVQALLERVPKGLSAPYDMTPPPDDTEGVDLNDDLSRALVIAVREGLLGISPQLSAIDVVLAEMSDEFDGDDVLIPHVRARLDATKAEITELHGKLQEFSGPFDLPTQFEQELGDLRKIAERAM